MMLFEIDVNMHYQLGDDPMVLLAIEAARTGGQIVIEDRLEVECATLDRIEGEDGFGKRVWAHVCSEEMKLRYSATVEVTRSAFPLESLSATPLHALPGSIVSYLRPSRFCQSDMFQSFVTRQFAGLEGGEKVAAIRDWVARELSYVPASSNAGTTALDTFAARQGVCRDYAHMVCAFARAAGIPARYASAYGPGVDPPDFHAVAQVWLDDAWHIVDATGMGSADALVLIAAGRDACDIAFMETMAHAQFIYQTVRVTPQ